MGGIQALQREEDERLKGVMAGLARNGALPGMGGGGPGGAPPGLGGLGDLGGLGAGLMQQLGGDPNNPTGGMDENAIAKLLEQDMMGTEKMMDFFNSFEQMLSGEVPMDKEKWEEQVKYLKTHNPFKPGEIIEEAEADEEAGGT